MNTYQQVIYTEKSIAADSEEKHDLKGFDPKYNNIVDYILKITHEIWEEKGIGVIYDTYAENIALHVCATTFHGINEVISSTLATQNALPDRRNFGEEVIWSTAPNGRYFSSHRLGSTGTHLGRHTIYGEPTGKTVFYRTFADCIIYNNKIEEEWLVRDNYSLLLQLGFDPIALAKQSTLYSHRRQFAKCTCDHDFGFVHESEIQKYPDLSEVILHSCGTHITGAGANDGGRFSGKGLGLTSR